MADENLHELDELGDEEHEGENDQAEECVTNYFAGDIAVEKAHGRKGECNMEGRGGLTEGKS
jgi:hypothetical protein